MKLRILEYESVSSTNDVAISFAKRGAKEGLVVSSKYQANGRGSGRRRWYSPKGKSVLATILLKPGRAALKLSDLTLTACKAVSDFLADYVSDVRLKLPNDVLVSDKKIAGVLVEGASKGRMLDWACVGIGVNIQARKGEIYRGGTSLMIENNRKLSIQYALRSLMHKFVEKYENRQNIT
ncbi:MAG: biotin--[acetyl-CoA-carboxylase] ligase [Candidatus Omnitrophica bacterium]|nr:biotin--[acetyl-CoA-carboxylase] ligase [Candidatus Omnitrophota bacterium]